MAGNRQLIALLGVCAILATGFPGHARDWGRPGGWDVVEGEAYCALSLEYEGEGDTRLMVLLEIDDSVVISVSNWRWSIEDGEPHDLRYLLGTTSYGGAASRGYAEDSIRKGFMTRMPAEFLVDFARAPSLHIRRGEILVDQLNLDGSGAALAQARRCLSHVKAQNAAAAREKARLSHIPVDPFAKPTP